MLHKYFNFQFLIGRKKIRKTVQNTDLIVLGTVNPDFTGGYEPIILTGEDFIADIVSRVVLDGNTTTFLGLTDTPAAYTAGVGYLAVINGAQDALEFVAPPALQNLASVLGEGTDSGANNIVMAVGQVIIFSNGAFTASITEPTLAGNIVLFLPAASGTIATTNSVTAANSLADVITAGNATGGVGGGEGSIAFSDGDDIIFDSTVGTKIGTAAGEKFAFWDATPIVQPSHVADPAAQAAITGAVVGDTVATNGGWGSSTEVGFDSMHAAIDANVADIAAAKTATDANKSAIDGILAQLASIGLQAPA